jgi:hypothetical protein
MNLIEEKLRLSEMSVNEVAETLQDRGEGVQLKASEMLCQQQAEIEALKLSLSGNSAEILSKNDKTLPNGKCEPVAWLVQYKDRHEFRWSKPEHLFEALAFEPLYTHPVKKLTDEEIEGIARANVDGHSSMEQLKWFAREILRKAQEK